MKGNVHRTNRNNKRLFPRQNSTNYEGHHLTRRNQCLHIGAETQQVTSFRFMSLQHVPTVLLKLSTNESDSGASVQGNRTKLFSSGLVSSYAPGAFTGVR